MTIGKARKRRKAVRFESDHVYNMIEAVRAMRLSYGSDGDSEPPDTIGKNDAKLIKELVAKGTSHRKFMRQILLSVDITAPRYWWTQFDTYKVGVTACSESTMHTIMKRPFKRSDFAHFTDSGIVDKLEEYRSAGMFEHVVANLPQSYLQKRHVTMNYEVVRNIREQREGHKLGEWKEFILWSDTLPYASLFFGGGSA